MSTKRMPRSAELSVYLGLAVLGTAIPWFFFAQHFYTEGYNVNAFFAAVFANPAACGFAADAIISATAFLCWSFWDARRLEIRYWFMIPLATFLVGMSLALPMYLVRRTLHERNGHK